MSEIEKEEEQLKSLGEVKAVYGKKWPGFFNNFHTKFPAIHKGSVADERGHLETAGAMDKPFSGFYRQKDSMYYSQKYLDQAPREFYETVDKVAMELGVSQKEIRRLRKLQIEAVSPESKNLCFEQLFEFIAPVFFG